MKAAATDVDSVVGTWEATPVGDVNWVQASSSCPPGYEQIPVIQNKKSPLACACEIGSTKKLQGMSDQPALSTSAPCWTNQTDNAQYRCADITGIPSTPLNSWKGMKQCIKRGYANALNAPEMTSSGCPDGSHSCGGATVAEYGLCELNTDPGCPVNWMASDATLLSTWDITGESNVGGISSPNPNVQPMGSSTSDQINNLNYYATNINGQSPWNYFQNGQVLEPPNKGGENWYPLPIVDIGMTFGVPCYGEMDAITGTSAGDMKASFTATDTQLHVAGGGVCTQGGDTRFKQQDEYDLGDLLAENVLKNKDESTNLCYSVNTDSKGRISGNYNYFESNDNLNTLCPNKEN
jgi:hypothetical protein